MSSEAQRTELHRTIWKIANDLRGSIDGWDFKTYVLGMLFYRFISENLSAYLDEHQHRAGEKDFNYAGLPDDKAEFGRKTTVEQKGFFMLPSELFENVRKLARNDSNLNETLDRVFTNIEASAVGAASEDDLKGLFDDLDVNSNKLGATVAKRNELLVKLLDSIGQLDFGSFQDNKIDAFGDAYEYLMSMYASNAGRSGGEFFTPQEVSELLARITLIGKKSVNKVYDPACGSGSLLLQYAKVLGKDNIREGFFGQEINLTTFNLCRINMFLHDINYEKFNIAHGDTLTDPMHLDDEPFEAIVSNPPYSIQWAGDADPLLINDERFSPAGVLAPKSKADFAFTMHILHSLAVNGTAAIVEFPGVMSRGGAEQKIRKYLVDNNYVDAVIQLPSDLFFGTTIATCILVLKKSKKENSTLFVDASALFARSQTKNKLMRGHMSKILEAVENRIAQDHFSLVVANTDVAANDYNLSVSTYITSEDTREIVNIKQLNLEIEGVVSRQSALRNQIDAIVADRESTKMSRIEELIRVQYPNGVDYQKLSDVLNYEQPTKYLVESTNYDDQFITPVLTAGQTFILGYTNETLGIYQASPDQPVIIFDDFTTAFKWVDFGFKAKSSAMKMLTPKKGSATNLRFVYFWMRRNPFKPKDHARQWISTYSNFDVPILPLEIQEEIVRILDTFTDLEAKLEAELEARKKQYEYYRDQLLTFDELTS